MLTLHLPWLELGIVIAALGSIWVWLQKSPNAARRSSLLVSGLVLVLTAAAWFDFESLHSIEAHDRWSPLAQLFSVDPLVVDELNATLLPLAALICFLINLSTMRTKVREFSFAQSLAFEAILLATLSCKSSWGLVALLIAGTIPPYLELRRIRKPTRVYLFHMLLFVVLLVLGRFLYTGASDSTSPSSLALLVLTLALFLRSGIVPFHCWMTDLFENATFGTALQFVTPMLGAYGVVRLVLPDAPTWLLQMISLLSLFTALYAAGIALVQREARRFYCYLFISHSSLVLFGISTATPIGLTGALCLWLSAALSLTGLGLTLRCIESRTGQITLTDFHGLYRHIPILAALFLLTGLASVGFPATTGFVGLELLVDGAVQAQPVEGAVVVIVAALNGLAVVQAYFRIFTGKPHVASIDLRTRRQERIAVLILTGLIVGGGLYPQPGVTILHRAAAQLKVLRAEGSVDQHASEPDQRQPDQPEAASSPS